MARIVEDSGPTSTKKVEIEAATLSSFPHRRYPAMRKSIFKVINELFKKGADVIYESLADVHVFLKEHACQEELKPMHSPPKFFVPVR